LAPPSADAPIAARDSIVTNTATAIAAPCRAQATVLRLMRACAYVGVGFLE